ncbi:MAG: acyl carrier protein, partial [Paludibacteraceae bacterium]|nr:acyl carrier protein [Paludibacteraceae bacterium]
MEKAELIEKSNEVLIEEFEVEADVITPDADIKSTLELDSLSLVDMVALIESEFKVKIKGSEIAQL